MYKKLIAFAFVMCVIQADDSSSKISTVLQNCATIVETMQNESIEVVQELLQKPEMREAFIISLQAAKR